LQLRALPGRQSQRFLGSEHARLYHEKGSCATYLCNKPLGTSVAVDLSLMGVGRRKQAASQLLDALFVWNWVGFGIAVLGGFLLFSIAATSFVSNAAFRVKLGILLPLALGMHILIQTKTRAWSRAECPPTVAKLAGLVELLLWMSVVAAAVSIPYVR